MDVGRHWRKTPQLELLMPHTAVKIDLEHAQTFIRVVVVVSATVK